MLSAIKVVCLCLAAVGLIAVGEVFFRRQVGKTASNVSWTGCGGGDYVRVDSIRIVGVAMAPADKMTSRRARANSALPL